MTEREPLLKRADRRHLPLLLTLVEAFCALDQHLYEPVRVESALRPLLEHDDFGVVYLVNDDQGYVVITWGYSLESGGREGLVDEIYLRQRGQGVGTQVMQALFDDLRGRGIVKMFLETERHNDRARTFYARQGFDADDSIWMSRSLTY
jgi:GNAT superfamily N-acetyltransferase